MTRKEQMLNGFTEMMKGLWNNQDLEIPNLETPCKQEPCNTCEHSNEIDGNNCYECVKGMKNNYSPITDVLDKIKAEVIARDRNVKTVRSDGRCLFTAEEVLGIIDKYKAESEDKIWEQYEMK